MIRAGALLGLLLAGQAPAAAPRAFLNGVDLNYWPYLSSTKWDSAA